MLNSNLSEVTIAQQRANQILFGKNAYVKTRYFRNRKWICFFLIYEYLTQKRNRNVND